MGGSGAHRGWEELEMDIPIPNLIEEPQDSVMEYRDIPLLQAEDANQRFRDELLLWYGAAEIPMPKQTAYLDFGIYGKRKGFARRWWGAIRRLGLRTAACVGLSGRDRRCG